MKKIIICILIIIAILLGIYIGFKTYNSNDINNNSVLNNQLLIQVSENTEISSVKTTAAEEEKTTPNTLIIIKKYFTKCQHYTTEYNTIDASLVNCTKDEFKEKNKGWEIEKFSPEEIVLTKEEEKFCNQHYKVKLKDDNIVIYNVDENGKETEYEETGITTEYLTEADILKLKTGIIIYGKENLMNVIEDYD